MKQENVCLPVARGVHLRELSAVHLGRGVGWMMAARKVKNRWMDLVMVILSEVSQRKTNTICYHLYVESKI